MINSNQPRPAILDTIETNNSINLVRQLTLNFNLRRGALTVEGKSRYERELRIISALIRDNARTSTNACTLYAASELKFVLQLLDSGCLDLSKFPYEKTGIKAS
jgi:hypothetical protein